MSKEAKARIKINEMLKEAGWKFFDDANGKANIVLENNIKITESQINTLGENFETSKNGFVDFLLLDKKGFPFIILEAKSEDKHALAGKEQARKYALSQHCRFIILSNGNSHYFWDTQRGNPRAITKFPSPESVEGYSEFIPNPTALIREVVDRDYIVSTQKPDYKTDPSWISEAARAQFVQNNGLRFLRDYQLKAIHSIQEHVKKGRDRFLFEMATGTGKTLVSAAVIKLFLRSSNARRVLFLVDRLELEDQAKKAFVNYLKNDYQTVVYKENRDDWRKAEIVVSTVQTFTSKNRYKRLFAPDDFDLVISDEAHRSIGGNSRAVFEYFIGYKLGLTATPKDYLKNVDASNENDPRDWERRVLMDTYKTFGCENGIPTYRYSLLDGVKEGHLINPVVVDARTEITAQMLADTGYVVPVSNEETEEGEESKVDEQTFVRKDFEKTFFSDETNRVFCETYLQNALLDPISGEIGKGIVFCVSQNHAVKITQELNEIADKMYPGKYQSDFAVQVTSWITEAQQFALNFSNNNLRGSANFIESYKTSKARVAVTVGMMTTGYDCPDILNLALMRPVFSPTDFIQIKGRGTRKHEFSEQITDPAWKKNVGSKQKEQFKLFDFFANCEYFEEDFNYNEKLHLPKLKSGTGASGPDTGGGTGVTYEAYESKRADALNAIRETAIGPEGMRVDRMYFQKFEDQIKQDGFAVEKAEVGDLEAIIKHIEENVFDKPEEFFNLEKLRKSLNIDRRVSLREIVEVIFGLKSYFKTRDEMLDEEFDKFDSRFMPDEKQFAPAKNFFKTYVLDPEFRMQVDDGNFAYIMGSHAGGESLRKLTIELRNKIIEYVKDYVSFNQFT
ncbi:MAG: DEAD/DEAH box helicase family protein [Anaerolineales bacterium]|nr:DEAD/DEAH box helicase family protein [Anaerolineales bacterium]